MDTLHKIPAPNFGTQVSELGDIFQHFGHSRSLIISFFVADDRRWIHGFSGTYTRTALEKDRNDAVEIWECSLSLCEIYTYQRKNKYPFSNNELTFGNDESIFNL